MVKKTAMPYKESFCWNQRNDRKNCHAL